VPPGQGQPDAAQAARPAPDGEGHATGGVGGEIAAAPERLIPCASLASSASDTVKSDRMPGSAARVAQGARFRVVRAGDQQPIVRQQRGELGEGGAHVIQRWVAVRVIVLDVGEDRHLRAQAEEHALVLVRLDDEVQPAPDSGVSAGVGQHAADDVGRVQPGLAQHMNQQGGSRRLAVRPGDGNAHLPGHQRAEQIAPAQHRDARRARCRDLQVILVGRRRDRHQVGSGDVSRCVPLVDRRAGGGQGVRQVVGVQVGAADHTAVP